MENMTQLTCPTCGAGLTAPSHAAKVKCSYCGNEFSIRQTAGQVSLETFARCPLCGRNDKVEKVSGIVARDTPNMSNGNIPTTALAQALMPPSPPPSPPAPGSSAYKAAFKSCREATWAGIIMLIVSFLFFASGKEGFFFILTGILGMGGGVFLIFWSRRKRAKLKKEFNVLWAKWRASMEAYQAAKERWERMYYCSRDDAVFIPGEDLALPPSRISEILSRRT